MTTTHLQTYHVRRQLAGVYTRWHCGLCDETFLAKTDMPYGFTDDGKQVDVCDDCASLIATDAITERILRTAAEFERYAVAYRELATAHFTVDPSEDVDR